MKSAGISAKQPGASPLPKPAAAKQRQSAKPPLPDPRILVPIDFSPPSKHALRVAAEFAKRYGGTITLMSALEPDPFSMLVGNPLVLTDATLLKRLESELTELGRKNVDEEHFKGIQAVSGEPFKEIVKAARSLKADLIIMATHGYTGLKHALLGSTAERVIRHAPCPVLTVQAGRNLRWPVALKA